MKLRKIALRNIQRNIRRSLLSMMAIAIAAACFVFLFSMIDGIQADMERNLQNYYSGEYLVRHTEYAENAYLNPLHLNVSDYGELIDLLETIESVTAIAPRIPFGTNIYREGNNVGAMGLGVDIEREKGFQDLASLLTEGRLPEAGKNEVLLTPGLAGELGLSVSDKMTVLTKTMRQGTNAVTFQISGIVTFPVSALNNSYFLAPIDRIQYLLRMSNAALEILVKTDESTNSPAFAERLDAELAAAGREELTVGYWKNQSETYSWIELANIIYNSMAFVFFLLGSTVIITTTMMVVYERMKEIGTIAAMGMTGGEIVRLFFLEAFFISVTGSFIGIILGIGLVIPASIWGLDFSAAMEGLDFEMTPIFYPVLNLRSTVFVFFYSTAVASLASLIPSRKAAKIEPVEALRTI